MSLLKDILDGRKGNVEDTQVQSTSEKPVVTKYNRSWLNRMSNKFDYIINEEGGKVDGILKALNRKDGHCPCGGNGDQFLCPCIIMRKDGICKCGLYKNIEPLAPQSTGVSAKIKEK